MDPELIKAKSIINDINNSEDIETSYLSCSHSRFNNQKRKLIPMVVIVNKRKSHPLIHEPIRSNSEDDMIICEEEVKREYDTVTYDKEKMNLEIFGMREGFENLLDHEIPLFSKSKSLPPLIEITQSLNDENICEEQVYPTIGEVKQMSDIQFEDEMSNKTKFNSNSLSEISNLSETQLNASITTKEEVLEELAQCKSNLTEMVQQTNSPFLSQMPILSKTEQASIITNEEVILEIEGSNLTLPETIQVEMKIDTKEEVPLPIVESNLTLPEIIQDTMPSEIVESKPALPETTSKDISPETPKVQLKCILKGFNDIETLAKQPKETRKIMVSTKKPKGYNQDFIILKALCSLPNREGTRSEIIKVALELEKKMCRESKLDKFFKGKTPGNSISASLTCNYKNIYTRIDKPGDKVQRFKATFPLDDALFAITKYKEWTDEIYNTTFKSIYDPLTYPTLVKDTKKKLKLEYKQFKQEDKKESKLVNPNFLKVNKPSFLKKKKSSDYDSLNVNPTVDGDITLSNQIILTNEEESYGFNEVISETNPVSDSNKEMIKETNAITSTFNPPNGSNSKKRKHKDKERLLPPTNWKQLFEVKPSTIPGAGYGLFALRFIPKGIMIGYYFGVPTTEYDFDKYKGLNEYTESYSIRYSNFVLDATDDNFKLYTEGNGDILCPFHYMNEHPRYTNCSFREGPKLNQIEVVTECDIFDGQELSVFYGCEYYRGYDI